MFLVIAPDRQSSARPAYTDSNSARLRYFYDSFLFFVFFFFFSRLRLCNCLYTRSVLTVDNATSKIISTTSFRFSQNASQEAKAPRSHLLLFCSTAGLLPPVTWSFKICFLRGWHREHDRLGLNGRGVRCGAWIRARLLSIVERKGVCMGAFFPFRRLKNGRGRRRFGLESHDAGCAEWAFASPRWREHSKQ
jgi:hypothetical protein